MLILASASPRRHELLTQAGLKFTAAAANLNEELLPDEAAAAYVQRLAEEKAQAVWNAQQIVGYGGRSTCRAGCRYLRRLRWPHSGQTDRHVADARRMLKLLSGRTHAVLTGHRGRYRAAGSSEMLRSHR